MERYQEVMVAHSEYVPKITMKCQLAENHDDVLFGLQYKLVISETMHSIWKVIIDHDQGGIVVISESSGEIWKCV